MLNSLLPSFLNHTFIPSHFFQTLLTISPHRTRPLTSTPLGIPRPRANPAYIIHPQPLLPLSPPSSLGTDQLIPKPIIRLTTTLSHPATP